MAKILIASPHISDNLPLLCSNQEANFPITNLQNIQLTNKWRTVSVLEPIIIDIYGAFNEYNFVALIGTNASSTATIRVTTAMEQSSLYTNPMYDSGTLSHWPKQGLESWENTNRYLYLGSNRLEPWIRITINDPDNLSQYYEAGRLYLSKAWIPTFNIGYGWSVSWNDNSEKEKSLGGNTFITSRSKYRQIEFDLNFQYENEMYDNAFELDRLRGTSKDILVIKDIDNLDRVQDQSVYGLMTELSPIVNTTYSIFAKKFKVEELL